MKKLMFALAVASIATAGYAQQSKNAAGTAPIYVEQSTEIMEVPIDPYKVVTNSFFSNWFLSFGAGAQVLFGDGDNAGKFGDRITPSFNIAVGKWFTPGLGMRIQYNGFQLKGFSDGNSAYIVGNKLPDGTYKQKFNYMNLHGDMLFNLNALFGGYNPDRVYEIIPYAGLGWAHSFDMAEKQYFAANFGMINRFRLSNAWDMNLELSAMLAQDQFDTQIGGIGTDAVLGASIGFTYKFGNRNFEYAPNVDAILALTSSQMDAINAALAQQIAQNKKLKQQLANVPQPVVAEEIIVNQVQTTPQSIFFEIGSSVIPAKDEVNLQYIADMMAANPEVSLKLTGYADSDTGSAPWNKQLSENRASSVCNALVKLGVSKDRLQVVGMGGTESLTPPSFNRRVIIAAQ